MLQGDSNRWPVYDGQKWLLRTSNISSNVFSFA